MTTHFYGSDFYGSEFFFGAPVAVTPSAGGDDVPRRKSPHKGFDLERWKAAQPDFETTLRQAYTELTRGPMQEEAREIVAPYIETGQHEVDWETLARDTEAVEELMRLREEEEIVMLFFLH